MILNLLKTAKFSKRFEDAEGKGEIASYEQFLLFPQCFQRDLILQTSKNKGLFRIGFNKVVVGKAKF